MLSVEENLRHHGHLYRLSGKTLADRINEMLERFSLTDRRRERVDRLSGGLRRRVELAKGLLTRPDLLLLDEPSTGLDPAAQAELWQQLCLIRDAGVTVLLTTHHMMEADICDRVLILDGGRIHADGSPDALKAQIGGDVVTIAGSGIIEMKPDVDAHLGLATQAIGGTLRFNTPSARRVIVPLMELLGDRVASVSVGKPSLQDVFMQMTGKTLSADDAS
jgi:ABC-2 type transport system ATP-binding protein